MGKLSSIIFINFIASVLLYDGGIFGILLRQLQVSTHDFQLIAAICLNFVVFFRQNEKYIKFYKLNFKSILLFLFFTIYYFLLTDFQNEYSVYKAELILFNFFILIFSIPLINNFRKYKILLGLIVLNVLISLCYNFIFPSNQGLTFEEDIQRRTFGEPIIYSRLIGFIILILYFYFQRIKIILIPILILALIIISTRTILFASIGLIVIHYFFNKSNFKFYKIFIFLSLLITVTIIFSEYQSNFYQSRLSSLDSGGRSEMLIDSYDMFLNNPITGNGVASFSNLHHSSSYFNRVYPHNIILELLSENGLLGLFLFSIFIISVYKPFNELIEKPFILYLSLFVLISALTSLDLPNQFLIFNLLILIIYLKNIERENRIFY